MNKKDMAKEFGVSENDLMCFANSVVNSIKKDKLSDVMLNTEDDSLRDLVIKGYVNAACDKIEKFHVSLITSPAKLEAFTKRVAFDLR